MHLQPDEAVDDNRRHHAIGRHAKDNALSDTFSDAFPDAHADTKSNTYANA